MRIVNPISRQLPPQPSENDDEFIAAASMAAEEEHKKNINKIK